MLSPKNELVRLSDFERTAIKECFLSVFKEGKIYLFGSRTDDKILGGDIDLLIETDNQSDLFEKKIQFLGKVKLKIGEQKIDVIFKEDENRIIEKEAQKWAIQL